MSIEYLTVERLVEIMQLLDAPLSLKMLTNLYYCKNMSRKAVKSKLRTLLKVGFEDGAIMKCEKLYFVERLESGDEEPWPYEMHRVVNNKAPKTNATTLPNKAEMTNEQWVAEMRKELKPMDYVDTLKDDKLDGRKQVIKGKQTDQKMKKNI